MKYQALRPHFFSMGGVVGGGVGGGGVAGEVGGGWVDGGVGGGMVGWVVGQGWWGEWCAGEGCCGWWREVG